MNAELFEAVERDDKLPVLRFLEKEGDVNTRDEYGDKTLLMIACLRNSKNIVYLLVTNSAAVNETSIRRCTPLMMAARKGNEDIVELLLKAKDIDVIAKNSWGMTAIHHAARCNYATILEKLLSFPVPVDIVDIENRTPLWFAASCGYLSCVDVLLKRGANPLHESKTQNSPLEIAKQNGYTHVVEKMEEAIRVTSHPYVEGYMSVIRQQDQQKVCRPSLQLSSLQQLVVCFTSCVCVCIDCWIAE
ncbi:receptor-interacting serine/threonine-protein kinase 4-like isoform X2 [Corticium candelabrum]|nr:receptor-interacting serine/threonine-protein kinase 4-like isoform X2 [Corticium candelabrum]